MKNVDVVANRPKQLVRSRLDVAGYHFLEAIFSELLFGKVLGFRDAVAIKDNLVAGEPSALLPGGIRRWGTSRSENLLR